MLTYANACPQQWRPEGGLKVYSLYSLYSHKSATKVQILTQKAGICTFVVAIEKLTR
jgi:hypothetical protein